MTPERIAEIAESVPFEWDEDDLDQGMTRRNIKDSIRQAVNEFAEEIVALVEEHARQYTPVNAALLEQARRSIRALKLPEE